MKKFNLYFAFVLLAGVFFFSSCEKEEVIKEVEVIREVPVEVPVEISRDVQRISFENVELNTEGFQNNFPDGLILSDVNFYNHYSNEGYIYWEGFAVSKKTDKETAGYTNDMSVYGTSGSNNSEKFGVVFSGFNETSNCNFLGNQEFNFQSLMINNSTYAALEIKDGGYSKKFEAGDWFKIIITGFAANGTKKGEVEFYLADFRDGKTFICQDWTKVDLSSLGKVNKLEFTFDSTDKHPEYGVNTPKYACIDDIVYVLN